MKLKSILFGGVCGLAAAESFARKPTFLRFDMSPYGEKDWRNVYNKGKPIGKQIMPVPLWAYEKDGKTHFAEFRIVKKWEENGEDCYRMYVYCGASIERKGGVVGFRAKKTDDGILNIEGVFTMKYGNAGKRETLSREEGEWALKVEMQRHWGTKDAKKVMGSVFIDGKPMAENNDRLPVDCGDWYSFIRSTGRWEFKTDGYCAVPYSRPMFLAAMGAFSDPSSSFCPSFLPSAGHLADTSPIKWKRLNALREYDSVFGDGEEALALSDNCGFQCFRAYSKAAKKTIRFEVIFFRYNDDFSGCSLNDAGLCSFCKEFREVLNHWCDPSCFEKEPSCSLFETNKIIQNQLSDDNKIKTASDPFEEDGGHPVFLRDCDLSVLPPDDVRRKHNIQPFPTLGCVSWDKDTRECYDFVPFKEKRIFRSRQKIEDGVRNRFVVFVKIPDDVSSDENKEFSIDVPYWSIQNMTDLSDVCASSYVEFSSCLGHRFFSKYKKHMCLVPSGYNGWEGKHFRVYRFDEDGKIAERDGVVADLRYSDERFCGIKYAQLLSNDDYCRLSLRKSDVPAGTAYSFDDYELSHRQNLRYQEGQWLCNFDEKKNGLEPKYFLTKEAGAEYGPLRYIEMIVVCLPENIKDLQSKLKEERVPHAYDIKKLEAVYKHWDDESWFEPKPKAGEAPSWPSLSVEELLGVISVEEAKKRGFAFEDETSKIEDKKEEPKAKSTIQYSKGSFDEK